MGIHEGELLKQKIKAIKVGDKPMTDDAVGEIIGKTRQQVQNYYKKPKLHPDVKRVFSTELGIEIGDVKRTSYNVDNIAKMEALEQENLRLKEQLSDKKTIILLLEEKLKNVTSNPMSTQMDNLEKMLFNLKEGVQQIHALIPAKR